MTDDVGVQVVREYLELNGFADMDKLCYDLSMSRAEAERALSDMMNSGIVRESGGIYRLASDWEDMVL